MPLHLEGTFKKILWPGYLKGTSVFSSFFSFDPIYNHLDASKKNQKRQTP